MHPTGLHGKRCSSGATAGPALDTLAAAAYQATSSDSRIRCNSRGLSDALVVTKLDRLGRSAVDLRAIADELEAKGTRLSIGGSVHDPTDPTGKLFFGMLSLMAEFESDLIRARTREGMAEAKKTGRLKGKQPKLSALQRKRLLVDYESGEYTAAQLCEISGLSRSAMYATLRRAREEAALSRT